MSTVEFRADYPLDNTLNPWGDYHRLVQRLVKSDVIIESTQYSLESDRGLPRLLLSPTEAQEALKVFFQTHATRTTT
jgi:hypothetical protein